MVVTDKSTASSPVTSIMSNSKIAIAILDDYHNAASLHFEQIKSRGATVTIFEDTLPPYSHPATSEDEKNRLVERLLPFTIICTMRERTPFPADLLKKLPNLKYLTTTGMRNAAIDVKAATELGIILTGTTSPAVRGPDSTTQHTWALILAITRGIARDDTLVKHGGWQTGFATGLSGKTLGVLGLGRLGAAVAKIAVIAFGMKVIAWSSSLTQEAADEKAQECGLTVVDDAGEKTFKAVTKAELFKQADILTVHYVLSDRSKGILGRDDLTQMKPTAYLVNTSRGPLIDEAALLDTLKAGSIRGAALDVFELEPLPKDSEWRTTVWGEGPHAQVLLSPHMGYVEEETISFWYAETAKNVERWPKGEDVLNRLK
ncbi:hypothetical protein FRB95_006520 [Tulasnella sp. JGI-2019a]|nr:hypothetical protein FRB95_006520 [Tulasnella sp. JGI-2019a]